MDQQHKEGSSYAVGYIREHKMFLMIQVWLQDKFNCHRLLKYLLLLLLLLANNVINTIFFFPKGALDVADAFMCRCNRDADMKTSLLKACNTFSSVKVRY